MRLPARLPLAVASGPPLGLALLRYRTPSTGVPRIADYYNFVEGAFDAGPFDRSIHLNPFARLGADASSPDYRHQLCSVPVDALDGRTTFAAVYTLDDQGAPDDLLYLFDPAWMVRSLNVEDSAC